MDSRERELMWLIDKINHSRSLIERADAYYEEYHHQWSDNVGAYFLDLLERKRDQLDYEEHRAERLGWLIASGRDTPKHDI